MINKKHNPACKPILHRDSDRPPQKHSWHYRFFIGMLKYLEKTSPPESVFSVHQCIRFCKDPTLCHEKVMHKIICHLRSTRDKDISFQLDVSKGIECYVNTGFAGG